MNIMSTQVTLSQPSSSVDVRLQPLLFHALNFDGSNFLEWINDAKAVLASEDLAEAFDSETAADLRPVHKWQALLILRRHLDTPLMQQYLQIEDPAELWTFLHARFHHEWTLFLPQAKNDWLHLRVLDFPDFSSFNSELHRITAQLRLCGECVPDTELIDKMLSTFRLLQRYSLNNIII